jgi:hypothetical protein
LGNYSQAINEGSALPSSRLSDALKAERDSFVYRSYIAMGQSNVVVDEVKDNADTPTPLLAVKLLAKYTIEVLFSRFAIFLCTCVLCTCAFDTCLISAVTCNSRSRRLATASTSSCSSRFDARLHLRPRQY